MFGKISKSKSVQAPRREGSIRITVEYDCAFIRGMLINLRDVIKGSPELIEFVMKAIDKFSKMAK